MLSRLTKVLLVLTAFAPVLVTYAFVQWRRGAFVPMGLTSLVVAVLLAALCFLILTEARRQLPVVECRLERVKTADSEIVAFVLSYLLPLANVSRDALDPYVLTFVLGFFFVI